MPVPGHTVYRLYRWLWAGLDLIYPPLCGGCGKRGVRWCPSCQGDVYIISPPICECCGRIQTKTGVCAMCLTSPPKYQALRSWAGFDGPVRNAIHRLKYQRDIALGELLTRPLIDCLNNTRWTFDIVVPVPLGIARHTERGYNQAALLALPLAFSLEIEYQPKALHRVKETRSQVGLSSNQRRVNVEGAFKARPNYVTKKSILVVDDVSTSGATLDACASALLSAGAEQIYGLTLARAL